MCSIAICQRWMILAERPVIQLSSMHALPLHMWFSANKGIMCYY